MFDEFTPPIEFTAAGATPEEQKTNLKIVKPSPGFDPAAELVSEAIIKNADVTVLDFNPQQVVLRFQIDGLWHSGAPMDRETGDYMLATLKQLAGLNYRERRARQEGGFGTLYLKNRQKFKVVSQGIQSGERVALYLDYKRPPLDTLEQLGMRASMIKSLQPILNDPKMGITLVSALPGEGFTSAWRGVLDGCDRLTRDYFVLEEKGKLEPEVINIYPIEFDPAKGEDAMSPIQQLLLKQPDVLAFTELTDGNLLNRIVDLSVSQNTPIFTRIPGKHCIDAMLRVLLLKPDVQKLAERLTCVVTMRLIRLLCDTCKIGFHPHPSLLQKLGIPVGRVAELFKPFIFQPGMLDENENEIEPCPTCSGIGYRGRTGLFEMLTLNDEIREALVNNPRADQIGAIAKRHGHISMQMEGVVVVASGRTSIEELQRVLKS
jgi:type II secretory ATPase GspE/PulE/Tfp pilus assembly ATPase PilB-like protein